MMTGNVFRATRDAGGLLGSVATEHDRERAGDKASYYMASGTPPGTWAGAGLATLGLSQTSELTRDQLEKLFGEGVGLLHGQATVPSHATSVTFLFMMVSNPRGVKRPRRAWRRRW